MTLTPELALTDIEDHVLASMTEEDRQLQQQQGRDDTEGAHAGRVLGTYMHGPALVRNPALADLLLGWVAGPLPPISHDEDELAQTLRRERLAAVSAT